MNPDSRFPRLTLDGLSAGGITKADIERRARELALIRTGGEDYSEEDLAAAARELLGARAPAMVDDAVADAGLSRDPSEPPSDRGTMAPTVEPPDENVAPERLALQGVEEAQHEQMVADRRRHHRD